MDAESWPLFGLRVRTPRLELRLPTDDDIPGVIEAALAGIHNDEPHPFVVPWTLGSDEELRLEVPKFHWRCRAELTADNFMLPFAVFFGDRVIGTQGMQADDFGALRTVETGSWLTREFQGQGLGNEMRAAILQLIFDGFGADVATSSARVTNARSLAVSRRMGYRENGTKRTKFADDTVAEEILLRLDRADWEPGRRDDIVIEGFDACRRLFALD